MDAQVWASTTTYVVGDVAVGIRSDTEETAALVDGLLGAYARPDLDAQANYSLRLSAPGSGGVGASFDVLYRSWRPVIRTRDRARLLDGLLGHLEAHRTSPRDDLVEAQLCGLVGPGGAVLTARDLFDDLERVERRLAAAGWLLVDGPWVLLDPGTGEVVVERPTLAHDTATAERFAASGRTAPRAEPGRYPVARWVLADPPASRAAALVYVLREVRNAPLVGSQRVLDGLARLLVDVRSTARDADAWIPAITGA